ncbi:MAG: hypothetical protein FWG75_05900 [Cystobacterineae bacterium]|nr:hypothetical protein [Cystobacterineae bacterium]
MPKISLLALVLGCFLTSCTTVEYYGDVEFDWILEGWPETFGCEEDPYVYYMRITISGVQYGNDYYCPDVRNGMVLLDMAPGSYSYRIDALDTNGYSLYAASGSFYVDGNVYIPVVLR